MLLLPDRSSTPLVREMHFFSAFNHFYLALYDPIQAIQRASLYAGYKIGERSASEGLLSAKAFETLYQEQYKGDFNYAKLD